MATTTTPTQVATAGAFLARKLGASFAPIALLFALLCVPLILSDAPDANGYTKDERTYHLPAVRQIRARWPRLDIVSDSLSAASPGYHYFLATVSLITTTETWPLRFVTWLVSLALLWLLWGLFPAHSRPLATATLLPLVCSNFFVKGASWVVTDNPALLCVAVTLAMALRDFERNSVWGCAALGSAATFIRQMNVWTAFPIALRGMHEALSAKPKSLRRFAPIAALAPVAILAILAQYWHGLVPPKWHVVSYQNESGSAVSLCYILAVFAIFGPFYRLALPIGDLREEILNRWTLLGAVSGVILASISRSDYSKAMGRFGGYLWAAVAHLPVLSSRSIVFLILAPCGGALFANMSLVLFRFVGRERGILWLGSYLAWAATFLPNRQIFQRYFEPTTLVFLVLWLLLLLQYWPELRAKRPQWLLTLAVVQVLITLATAYSRTFGHGLFPAY